MLKLNEPEKLRYWQWFKYKYCPELCAHEDFLREEKQREEYFKRLFRLPEEYYKND